MKLRTAQMRVNVDDAIDITRGSLDKRLKQVSPEDLTEDEKIQLIFAPPWSLISSYKGKNSYRKIDEKEYTKGYLMRLNAAFNQHYDKSTNQVLPSFYQSPLYSLIQRDSVTLKCYCPAGSFCHRHIAADFIERMARFIGVEVENLGEVENKTEENTRTRVLAYDIEVFKNFFSATFLDVETKETFSFVVYNNGEIDDRDALRSLVSEAHTLIGFNNISYDDPVLCYVLDSDNVSTLNHDLYRLSSVIVENRDYSENVYRTKQASKNRWKQLDLMKLGAFHTIGVSLKQVAINLRWHRIQDLPLPHDHVVKRDEIQTVLDYNLNDVMITFELWKSMQKQIKLRDNINNIYNVDVTSASDSGMANAILEKIYTERSGLDASKLKDLRTKRKRIILSDCVPENIQFATPVLQEVLSTLKNTIVDSENKFKYAMTVNFDGMTYKLGVGGLHSEDKAGKFYSTEDVTIRDADVASYYPNIMLNGGVKPAHLGDDFLEILRDITTERLEAKRNGDKTKADGLKITINSIFGKLGSDTFWLEDAKGFLSVTLAGQLYLLMLIEALAIEGIHTISANTDGIVCKVPKTKEDIYYHVCDWWQRHTKFTLEYTDYQAYIRSDVNNYITLKPDGDVKTKGRFSSELDLRKGYRYPVVAKSLYRYFIDGVPIEDAIEECHDILDFCISQKTGRDFQMEQHDHLEKTPYILQKNNRFYISNSGYKLVKRNKKDNSVMYMYGDRLVRILNDYDRNLPFERYDVDKSFYLEEVRKIVDAIEPLAEQMSMFNLDDYDDSIHQLDIKSLNLRELSWR